MGRAKAGLTWRWQPATCASPHAGCHRIACIPVSRSGVRDAGRTSATWNRERMHPSLSNYPWVSPAASLHVLRVMTAVFFLAHAIVRICNGTIPRFGDFMEAHGFAHGVLWVWAITLCELVCGVLMVCNRMTRWAASGLAVIAAGGIVIIHVHRGWFVGEHGTGGCEYSVALLVMLLVVAAFDAGQGVRHGPGPGAGDHA
ncbi:MAG: DoxX family protein [Pseudoxanthomonas sp.]